MTAISRALAILLLVNVLVWTQDEVPDISAQMDPKTYTCGEYIELVDQEDPRAEVHTVWANGYYSARQEMDETSAPITFETLVVFGEKLQKTCRERPGELFFVVLKELK